MSILHTCSTHGCSLEQWVVGWAAGGLLGEWVREESSKQRG